MYNSPEVQQKEKKNKIHLSVTIFCWLFRQTFKSQTSFPIPYSHYYFACKSGDTTTPGLDSELGGFQL